jgi:Leucine-rich repeat (LRR) protein
MFPNGFSQGLVTNFFADAFPVLGLKSVEVITEEFLTIQQKAFRGEALTVSDIAKLNGLLANISSSSLPASDKKEIANMTRTGFTLCTDPSETSRQNAKLEDVSIFLLKNCSDEAISHFLGLDTWQSEGNIQEAKARIIHFVRHADGNPQKLDLSNLGLSLLPEKMFPCLVGLTDFFCDGNHLTSLPITIWNVPRLQTLNVSNNKLTSLPAAVENCLGLRKLILNNNCLSSLPVEIGCLSFLGKLDCAGNRFTELPGALIKFKGDVRLNFCSNWILSCPPEFGHLTLDISNQNSPVRAQIQGSVSLVEQEKAKLSPLEIIVEEFLAIQQKLSGGKALSANDILKLNQLLAHISSSSLPNLARKKIARSAGGEFELCTDHLEGLRQCIKLETISRILLGNCSDEAISHFLGLDTWQSEGNTQEAKARIIHSVRDTESDFQKLDLSYLGLSLLPEKMFPCLINLQDFSCDGNKLTSLPASIYNSIKLEKLVVSNNKLKSLPIGIDCLCSLRELELSNNQLRFLPMEINCVRSLRKLELSNNCLSSLPAGMDRMRMLRTLNCAGNRFTELPQILTTFSGSVYLNFSSNHIFSCPPELARRPMLDLSDQNPLVPGDEDLITAEELQAELGAFQTVVEPFGNAFVVSLAAQSDQNPAVRVNRECDWTVHPSWMTVSFDELQAANLVRNRSPQPVPGLLKLKQAVSDTRPDLKNLNLSNLEADTQAWATISLFIDKIVGTDDFIKFPAMTAQRLLLILQLAETNEEYRTAVNAALMEALSSCVDRASFFFCSLEIQKAILEAGNGSLEEMFKVLKGAHAIELFDIWASDFVKRHPDPRVKKEALSVHLALKVEFKKEFCLPIGIEEMNYRFCAHLQPLDYQNARSEVIGKLQNQGPFLEFLLGQEPWLEKLRKDFSSERDVVLHDINQAFAELEKLQGKVAELEGLRKKVAKLEKQQKVGELQEQQIEQLEKWRRRIAKLEGQQVKLTDQEYTERCGALMEKFKAVESAWLKAKTQAILAAG